MSSKSSSGSGSRVTDSTGGVTATIGGAGAVFGAAGGLAIPKTSSSASSIPRTSNHLTRLYSPPSSPRRSASRTLAEVAGAEHRAAARVLRAAVAALDESAESRSHGLAVEVPLLHARLQKLRVGHNSD